MVTAERWKRMRRKASSWADSSFFPAWRVIITMSPSEALVVKDGMQDGLGGLQLIGAHGRADDLAAELPEVCDDPPEPAALGSAAGVLGVEPLAARARSGTKGDHILGHSR